MFLNMDQLEKQLDNENFQKVRSTATFKVLETQFQMFINLRIYLDDEYVVMIRNYFLQYTQLEISEFHDTLIQHMESVKKSIDKRSLHKREYDRWVNERQMHTTKEKVDTSKALDANIKPIYDEEPMAEERESDVVKPHHVIASSESRNSSKNMPRFSLNDMVHNHYLEEAKKKTQKRGRNLRPSVMPSAKSQSTTNGSKPKPRSNTQTSRNWPTSKNSKIFKTVGLRWVPTGKIFTSSTTKVDSKPTNGSDEDITSQYEYEKTLDVSAGTLNLSAGTSYNPKKEGLKVCLELRIHDHSNEPSSSKLVPKVVPQADKTTTSRQELELLFHQHITMLSSTCTDKTNITRKPSKTSIHEHGNQKSTKEAKDSNPKPRKVNYGQASVKESQP
ncbi:hypothetical protein Tco_0771972 [Tanacetum coccineum]|uniref:Uncharacterized protein n=1 Tax=Tanacetum coccineum TaxID=301880 RepID=A0ABQ4ZIK2_9ASTR